MKKAALLVVFSSWLLIAIVTIIFAVVTYPDNFLTSTAAKEAYMRNKFAERLAAASADWTEVTWEECDFQRTRFLVWARKNGFTYVVRSFAVDQYFVEARQNDKTIAVYTPKAEVPPWRWHRVDKGHDFDDYTLGKACEELYLAFSKSVFYKQAWW